MDLPKHICIYKTSQCLEGGVCQFWLHVLYYFSSYGPWTGVYGLNLETDP